MRRSVHTLLCMSLTSTASITRSILAMRRSISFILPSLSWRRHPTFLARFLRPSLAQLPSQLSLPQLCTTFLMLLIFMRSFDDSSRIVKFFSPAELTDEFFSEVFESVEEKLVWHWERGSIFELNLSDSQVRIIHSRLNHRSHHSLSMITCFIPQPLRVVRRSRISSMNSL